MASLVVLLNDEEVQRFEITKTIFTVGRDKVNDLRIDNPAISRIHAEVRYVASGFIIEDKSTNGLLVNGQKVERYPLRYEDVVDLGKFKLRLTTAGGIAENRLINVVREEKETANPEATFHMPLKSLQTNAVPDPIDIDDQNSLKQTKIMAISFIVLVIVGVAVFFALKM